MSAQLRSLCSNLAADLDARISATVSFSGATNQGVAALSFEGLGNLPTAPSSGAKDGPILPPKVQERVPLEQAAEAYAKMMRNEARFRMVIDFSL